MVLAWTDFEYEDAFEELECITMKVTGSKWFKNWQLMHVSLRLFIGMLPTLPTLKIYVHNYLVVVVGYDYP